MLNTNDIPLELKTLIVEDDLLSKRLVIIAAKKFSKEILTARTGIEAINVCRNHPDIDLVLMDIQLPEMNGYEATRQIREFNKKCNYYCSNGFWLFTGKRKDYRIGLY